jgi:alpha/beta hydrolase fold
VVPLRQKSFAEVATLTGFDKGCDARPQGTTRCGNADTTVTSAASMAGFCRRTRFVKEIATCYVDVRASRHIPPRVISRIGKHDSSLIAALVVLGLGSAANARVEPFPPSFRVAEVKTDGAVIHVRVGGQGPAVLMLHGFGDTGDMWQPLAVAMMRDHTVVVPDLRGMGLSSHPDTGYDKKTEARDIARRCSTASRSPGRCNS